MAESDHLISAASAFWGLATVIINSAIQPVENFCDIFAAAHSAPMRLSPTLTLLDNCIVAYQFVRQWRRSSLREAIRAVAKRRGLHDDEVHGTFNVSTLLVIWIVRVLAVLQAVKLFGMRGIPVTLTLGAIYLSSFLLIESLIQFGKPMPTTNPNNGESPEVASIDRRLCAWLVGFALLVQAVWMLHLIAIVIPALDFWLVNLIAGAGVLSLWILFVCCIMIVFVLICGTPFLLDLSIAILSTWLLAVFCVVCFQTGFSRFIADEPMGEEHKYSLVLTLFFLAVYYQLLPAFSLTTSILTSSWMNWVPDTEPVIDTLVENFPMPGVVARRHSTALFWLAVSASATFSIFQVLSSTRLTRRYTTLRRAAEDPNLWFYMYHTIVCISSAILYYIYAYDGTGTYKPAWAEYLG